MALLTQSSFHFLSSSKSLPYLTSEIWRLCVSAILVTALEFLREDAIHPTTLVDPLQSTRTKMCLRPTHRLAIIGRTPHLNQLWTGCGSPDVENDFLHWEAGSYSQKVMGMMSIWKVLWSICSQDLISSQI